MSMVEPDLVFEPYHYHRLFCVAGLKLVLERNPSDHWANN